MENLKTVLEEANSFFEKRFKTTCYLSDMDNFVAFNEVYSNILVLKLHLHVLQLLLKHYQKCFS